MRWRRAPEAGGGRIKADGTIEAGDGFTCNKTGTGTYVLTFPFRVVSLTVQSISAIDARFVVFPFDGKTCTVGSYQWASSTLLDNAFSFTVVGPRT